MSISLPKLFTTSYFTFSEFVLGLSILVFPVSMHSMPAQFHAPVQLRDYKFCFSKAYFSKCSRFVEAIQKAVYLVQDLQFSAACFPIISLYFPFTGTRLKSPEYNSVKQSQDT
jgi:hypothetical protein